MISSLSGREASWAEIAAIMKNGYGRSLVARVDRSANEILFAYAPSLLQYYVRRPDPRTTAFVIGTSALPHSIYIALLK